MNTHRRSRHHLIPKSRRSEVKHSYSKSDFEKTLTLWVEKHRAWHLLFGNQTIEEIIETLERIKKIKFR